MSNINPWTLFILGILVGWLLSWLLELWHFRRKRLSCQREVNRLEGQLRARNAELGAASSQISALRGEIGMRATEIDALLYQMAKQEQQESAEPATNKAMPVLEAFDESVAIIEEQDDTPVDSDDYLETTDKPLQDQNPLDAVELNAKQWTILRAAGIETEEDLASISPDDLEQLFQAPEWQHAEDEPPELNIQTDENAQIVASDDMTLINGIGPKHAATLEQHGITTFAQLSATDPETLSALFETSVGRPPDFKSWIDQAQMYQVEN